MVQFCQILVFYNVSKLQIFNYSEDIIHKPENSRKLVKPQDLKTPDIVTWLPVLLTASSSSTSNSTNSTASSKLTNSSVAPEAQTKSVAASAAASAASNGLQDGQSGQKTLASTEDGLVFRSPEMKRSLQRQKKTKKMSKTQKTSAASASKTQDQISDSDSDNSDSFYETLRRHQRTKRKNSLGHKK